MWKFEKSSTDKSNYLNTNFDEVCFIGRSNVGKSSLINAISNSKIAKTSNTPGKTQLINFFSENKKIFVDLPGYGYAKMSKDKQNTMLTMIENYIENRVELIRVFLLVDSKIGPTKDDKIIIDYLKKANKDFFIILSKSDKANQSLIYKSKKNISVFANNYLEVSSHKNINLNKLKKIIYDSFK